MNVRMRTIYASARGNCDPGKTIDLPADEAAPLAQSPEVSSPAIV